MSLVVTALLAVHVILALVALQAVFTFVELAWRVVAGRDELRGLLATHLEQFRWLRLVQLVLWVATAAAVVRWVGRAHGNLTALGATPSRSPRQAMLAFLVPGLNLVRPLRVLSDLWTASDPAPAGPGRRGPAARVRWWWGLLLATVVAETAARGLALRSGSALDLGLAMQLLIAGQLLTIAAAVVGIAAVLGLDARQEAAAWSRSAADSPG